MESQELFQSFACDTLLNATKHHDLLEERGIRRWKWYPLWWTFIDPQMEDLYSEMSRRLACWQMWTMAVILFPVTGLALCVLGVVAAYTVGSSYFTRVETIPFYMYFVASFLTVVGAYVHMRRFEKRTFGRSKSSEFGENNREGTSDVEWGGISSATAAVVPSKGTWGGLKGSGRGASEHSKTPGGRQSESRTVALRRLTSERPKAISRSDRSGSRLEEPPPTTVTASKDPAEPAEEDPTVKPITDEAEAPRQEGEWRQRMWENREEWEKWKGGSFEREVREYWRGLFLICLTGTLICGASVFVFVASTFPTKLNPDTHNGNCFSTLSSMAVFLCLWITTESMKNVARVSDIYLAVLAVFLLVWDATTATLGSVDNFDIFRRTIVLLAFAFFLHLSGSYRDRARRAALAVSWEARKNRFLVEEAGRALNLHQRFTMGQALFFQKIVHDLKTPLWSIMHAFETVRDCYVAHLAKQNKGVGGGGGAGTKVKKVEESAGRFSDFSHDPNAHPERGENQVENAPEVLWKKREDEVQEEQAQGREHRRKDLCEGEERIWPMIQTGLASTVYMQSLAMNLLEVARLKFSASTEDGGTGGEDGAVQLACGIGSILRCLESVGVMMTPAGSVKGVEVEVVDSRDESSKEGGEMAWFDETRLLQAAANGVSNGVKYTKSGGKVTVRLSEGELLSDPSGDSMGISVVTDPLGKQEAESIILSAGLQCGSLRRFQIEIRDTGRGIPEDKMKDIWSEYAQVKAQDAAVGSGLGLSIVKAILTAMGGSAHISSEEGVGTCLNLSFVVRTLVPRGGSLGGQEDEESVGAGTDDSLAMPNHLERSFNHSFMNSMSGKGGESNPFSLKRMRLGPGRREKSLSVDQVSSADGFPTLKSRQAVPQRRTPSGPGLFSGVGGKMKGMKSKSGGENGNGLSDVSVKRCVWEGLKRQAEAGRPDILWAELEGMPVETLSALLVQETGTVLILVDDQPMMLRVLQDIVKKVGFPPDRTLSFEDPQEVPPQILSLVGGPLPQGQTTPAVEGVGSVLMLTDMQMGDMSGLALTRKVKDVVKEVGAVVGPFPDPLACKNDQEMGLTEPLITDHGGKPIPLKDALWRSNSQLDSQKPIPLKDALWRSNSQLDSPPSPKSVQHEGERLKRKDKRERSTASAPPESAHGILRACTNSHASKGDASNFFCGGSQLSDDKSGGPNGKSLHPSQTGSKRASVQWAVRLAPPPDEACVLRLCLLSAQLRSGILERHPEADTVMDEILEKPLYPPSLAEQLRLLAAHVLFNRGRNKAGGATQT